MPDRHSATAVLQVPLRCLAANRVKQVSVRYAGAQASGLPKPTVNDAIKGCNSLCQSFFAGLQQDRHAEHQPLAVSLVLASYHLVQAKGVEVFANSGASTQTSGWGWLESIAKLTEACGEDSTGSRGVLKFGRGVTHDQGHANIMQSLDSSSAMAPEALLRYM